MEIIDVSDVESVLDTNVLIREYRNPGSVTFTKRSPKKTRSKKNFAITTVTAHEILVGCKTQSQKDYWYDVFSKFVILPFNLNAAGWAATIQRNLHKKGFSIETTDLYIASTAVAFGLKLASYNQRHFEHIEELELHRF